MRVLIAAGGTAGHINPALAIAGALKAADPAAEIHFAGRKEGMEYGLVTKAGYPFHHIEINGFQRKPTLKNVGRNVVALYHLALSGPRTAAILKEVRPCWPRMWTWCLPLPPLRWKSLARRRRPLWLATLSARKF